MYAYTYVYMHTYMLHFKTGVTVLTVQLAIKSARK